MMRSGTAFEGGEVVLVPFPFTDLSDVKRRPVLVVSNLRHNKISRGFICCGITSNPKNRAHSVVLAQTDMLEGALPVRSRIKFDKVFTLERTLVIKVLGKVSAGKLGQVRSSMVSIIS